MAANKERARFSNTNDAFVSIFYDGRLKATSPKYKWHVDKVGRHNALGEFVRIVPGEPLEAGGGVELGTQITLDPDLDTDLASTVVCSNGSFVQFEHSGTIVLGNDGRDIEETLNAFRDESGGGFYVRFSGSYVPPTIREGDHAVNFRETKSAPLKLFPGEVEIKDGRVRR